MSPDRYVWSRAVAASLTGPEAAEELRRHTELLALREEADEARRRMRELIDFDALPPATLAFDDLRRKLMALVPAGAEITPEAFATEVLGDRALFVSGEREKLSARAGPLTLEEIRSVRESIAKSRLADVQRYTKEAVLWFSQRLASGQIRHRFDAEDWNRAFLQAGKSACIALLVRCLPPDFGLHIGDEAVDKIRSALQPSSDAPAWKWNDWGAELILTLARPAEAVQAFRESITRDPHAAAPRGNLGLALLYHFDRYAEAEIAFRESIARDPDYAMPWNGLGLLYTEYLDRHEEAADAFASALRVDPHSSLTHQNRIFLHRDFMGEGSASRPLMAELLKVPEHRFPDTTFLHEALFAAYDANWGTARTELGQALTLRSDGLLSENTDDWLRASAVLIHLNYGAELLAFLDERGDTQRLRPWVEALRALHLGDRRVLQNIAPEIRTTAEIFYDGIERRLLKLPEKTRRRPLAKPRASRSRRK